MPLWKKGNDANSAPKFVTDAATGETGKQEYGAETILVYGTEGYPVPPGWVSRKQRGTRTLWESLATFKSGALVFPNPIASTFAIPNEYNGTVSLGAANTRVGSTTHHVCMEDVDNASFEVWYPNFGATAGYGEWNLGADATGRCSILWIDANGASQTTQLLGKNGSADVVGAAGDFIKFYGPTVRPKVGSHFYMTFYGIFPNGAYYSHGKADYANGDGLQYGAAGAVVDRTGTSTPYGNSWTGGGDYYGPALIGMLGSKRPTMVNDGDSREAGVLVGSDFNFADDLYGAHGEIGRFFAPYMAIIDISIPGGRASEMADATKTKNRDILAKLCTVHAYGLGVNDMIFNADTSATVQSNAEIRKNRIGAGAPSFIYKTISPVVTNKTTNTVFNASRDPQRLAENTRRRALAKTFDAAAGTENGSTGTLVSLTYTMDGAHNLPAGDKAAVAANAAYNVPVAFPGANVVSAGVKYPTGHLYQSLNLSTDWTTQQSITTVNSVYSPEHKRTAILIKEDATASANHRIFSQQTLALASTTKKVTVYVKRVTGSRNVQVAIQQNGGSYLQSRVAVNLSTGALFFAENNAGTVSGYTATQIDDYWKIEFNVAFLAGHPATSFLYVSMSDATGLDTYNGDNTSSIAAWGYDIR